MSTEPTFAQLRAQYEAALAEERAHDKIAMPGDAHSFVSSEAEVENDRLTDLRYLIEIELMAIPSPDASAFAFKTLVAHGDGRETDCWNAMLEQEAKRFANAAAPGVGAAWCAALTDYEDKKAAYDHWASTNDDNMAVPACDAWCAAMDHLVENVRAPNVEALGLKIEWAKERWDGFTIPEAWLDAFEADARALAGAA